MNPQPSIDIAKLQKDPKSVLDALSRSAPGLYSMGDRPALFVTDPESVVSVLTSSAFEKTAATLRYRYALGDGTATSGFTTEDRSAYAPLSSLHALRRRKRTWLTPAFRARPADVAGSIVRSVQTAIADLAPCAEVELHNFTSELILRAEIADLFNRQIPESVLAAYRLYRDTLCEVDQQIRAATSCDAIFIRGSSTAVQGQMTASQSKRRALFHQAVRELIDAQVVDSDRTDDPITLLQQARFVENDQPMSEVQLYNSLIGLIFASFENTATSITWALWLLATHPDCCARVRAECMDGTISLDGYLASCIDETLRLQSPVWSLGRECVTETSLGGKTISAGTVLFVSPWVQHRHQQLWEDSTMFHPERFQTQSIRNDGRYLPFGLGPQMCLGRMRSLTEIAAVVATLLRDRNVEPVIGKDPPEAVFRTIQRPEPGVYVRLTKRSDVSLNQPADHARFSPLTLS